MTGVLVLYLPAARGERTVLVSHKSCNDLDEGVLSLLCRKSLQNHRLDPHSKANSSFLQNQVRLLEVDDNPKVFSELEESHPLLKSLRPLTT